MKINISSIGDPMNPKNWSGTPLNLCTYLKEIDMLGITIDSTKGLNKASQFLLKMVSKVFYLNSIDVSRGRIFRFFYSRYVGKETASSNSNITLHMGTLDLPFKKIVKEQNHFLYCDSTWNLWSGLVFNKYNYSKKLCKDSEKLEQKAYNQMKHIFCISEYVKSNLVEHYKVNINNITAVGTGLGIIRPYYGKKNYANGKILFVAKGRFEDKGGVLVLKAFEEALKTNPNLELSIVGQKEYLNKINLPNVKVYGFVELQELQEIFNNSSLFVMPAINEPWGLVYLEALACKIPIIGLNKNSFPEISDFGNYGFGLEDSNPLVLANLINHLFNTPKELEEMGKKGQQYCLEKYTWQNSVDKIIKTIDISKL